MKKFFSDLSKLLKLAYQGWKEDNASRLSAALAYYTVLSIARNVPALDESPVPAGGRIRAVLELASGRAAQLGILPGDRIVHRIFPRG